MKLQAYKLHKEDKVLRVLIDDSGWYYIAKMPIGRDNIFISIEEIEIVLDVKLDKPACWEKEIE